MAAPNDRPGRVTSFIPMQTVTRSGRIDSVSGNWWSSTSAIRRPRTARLAYASPGWSVFRWAASRSANPIRPPCSSRSHSPSV
ncbi:hypothetical protein AU196_08440 [Mycobacterium sp. IS-1742]|nr:hypothetical protein AU196_08440 [Mycobacterium sp. IS-1742]